MSRRALLITCAVLLPVPACAEAGTVTYTPGYVVPPECYKGCSGGGYVDPVLRYDARAATADANVVTLSTSPDGKYVLRDELGVTLASGQDTSDKCAVVDARTVACSVPFTVAWLGAGNDTAVAADGVNTHLAGMTGNDALTGSRLDGGEGSDTLTGSAKDDRLNPGPGEDVVHAGAGNDTVIYRDAYTPGLALPYTGPAGPKEPAEGSDADKQQVPDQLFMEDGDDTVALDDTVPHVLDGGAGTDTVTYGTYLTLKGPLSLDLGTLTGFENSATAASPGDVVGTDGPNVMTSLFYGSLDGRGGDDVLTGGDRILGGDGNDRINAKQTADVDAGAGDDTIAGSSLSAFNSLVCGPGTDTVTGHPFVLISTDCENAAPILPGVRQGLRRVGVDVQCGRAIKAEACTFKLVLRTRSGRFLASRTVRRWQDDNPVSPFVRLPLPLQKQLRGRRKVDAVLTLTRSYDLGAIHHTERASRKITLSRKTLR